MPDGVLRARRFFGERSRSAEGWSALVRDGREWESFYRERWQHDRVVRSTHGVNCTGSCSWKIHVKDGIVAWETQQTDYPRTRPELPNHEPRGCSRGASYSWYLYSANRVKYPMVRGRLLRALREARRPRSPIPTPSPAGAARAAGWDGGVATNTSLARDGVEGLPHAAEAGGLSGAPIRSRATRTLALLAAELGGEVPLIGAGGIMSGSDAAEKFACGAALVQLYTGLIYRGPALVAECAAAHAHKAPA